MEYTIKMIRDSDAGVWIATNDEIPLTLEDESFDALVKRVQVVAPEIAELNHMPYPQVLCFTAEERVEVSHG